jgi:hypothetical protein
MKAPAWFRSGWPLVAAAWLAWSPAPAAERADFLLQVAVSTQARHVADWVLDAGDHAGRPFVIVDKLQSRVFVFGGDGRLLGATPALLGLALGDESVPGIGTRLISAILPQERTTPAGRFAGYLQRSLVGEEILWVDYDTAVALHPVSAKPTKEQRLKRMASLVVSDRRITYGCINVPAVFFATVIAPLFRDGGGVIYVLPETRSPRETFGSYELPALLPGLLPALVPAAVPALVPVVVPVLVPVAMPGVMPVVKPVVVPVVVPVLVPVLLPVSGANRAPAPPR